MNPWKKWRAGVVRRKQTKQIAQQDRQTYVMDVEWHRSEELRADRLGPSEDDVEDPERVRTERWRPRRTLG